jgi:hypothetical protein
VAAPEASTETVASTKTTTVASTKTTTVAATGETGGKGDASACATEAAAPAPAPAPATATVRVMLWKQWDVGKANRKSLKMVLDDPANDRVGDILEKFREQ